MFAWESVREFRDIILVEGLFDLAGLWQAGFRNTTCAIGTHLTPAQLAQLHENPDRCVYIAFDQDQNQAGQTAANDLLQYLDKAGLNVRLVELPAGHDPNSYFRLVVLPIAHLRHTIIRTPGNALSTAVRQSRALDGRGKTYFRRPVPVFRVPRQSNEQG